MHRRALLATSGAAIALAMTGACWSGTAKAASDPIRYRVVHSDAAWRRILSPASYQILRRAGTEPPFSSPLLNEHRVGHFNCAGCALPLYASTTKYDSFTGWPSFWAHLPNAVLTSRDNRFGMQRTEIHCSQCGGHLGHVFDDGPQPTGLRYCMNGLALTFTPTRA